MRVPEFACGIAVLLLLGAAGPLACGEEPPPPPEPVRPVKMLTVGGPGAGGTREYPGRIKAARYAEMSFEVPGRVTEFRFNEGAEVKKGEVLARIDPADYQARYDSAVAKLSHAKAERDRFKAMYEKEVKPYSEYELRIRAYQVQEAAVREARKALNDTELRAPFDGTLARRLVEVNENVLAKMPVLVFQDDSTLEIKVSVPERDLAARSADRQEPLDPEEVTARLHPRVVVSSLPGREFPARLKELATVADPTTRTFEATFLFQAPADANILGGMTAKVVIDVPQRVGGAILVPATAVTAGADREPFVWVVDPDTMAVSKRPVVLGELTGDDAVVASGLEAGDTVVVSGVNQLRDGMIVRRYESQAGAQ